MFIQFRFKAKVTRVLEDEFGYSPDQFDKQTLAKVCRFAKSESLNEYDAAVIFMVAQLKQIRALNIIEDEAVPTTASFVTAQISNLSRLLNSRKLTREMVEHELAGTVGELRKAFS